MNVKYVLMPALALLIAAVSCTTEDKPNLSRPDFIIDSHIHYRATDEWESTFVDVYTRHKAMACILVGMKDLDRGMQFYHDHPELVIPYAAIDIDSPTVTDDIRKVKDMGFKGLGELFATKGWDYDDPKHDSIWILAEQFKMPILPHTGIHARGNFSGMRPAGAATIAERHRGLIIHAAHLGNPWYAEAAEGARINPNLYYDLTGSSLIKKSDNPGIWTEYLWWTDHIGKPHVGQAATPAFEKILFGTDELPNEENLVQNIIRFNRMLDACKVPQEMRENMYGKTFARIHGIKTVHGFPVN